MVKKIQISLSEEFQAAIPVIRQLEENGFEAYFVGGSVRDSLLQKRIHDVDIATSAFPSEIKAIFPRTVDVGIEHGTVMVLWKSSSYEITTFRTESSYQDYRRPDHVTFVRSLEEDLKRRDFTINAFAMDKEGTVFDYFTGLTDMQNQLIRAVGNPHTRFHEDGLRMMRAIRFQSNLGFQIEKQTCQAIKENSYILQKISIERVHDEFIKMMLGKHQHLAILSFLETNLYRYCPGFLQHATALKQFTKLSDDIKTEVQVWTLFGYFAGLTTTNLESLLREWKSSNKLITEAKMALLALYERLSGPFSKELLYRLGEKLIAELEWLVHLLTGDPYDEMSLVRYAGLPIHKRSELAINGGQLMQALGKSAGPWLGDLIENIERQVVIGELVNTPENIIAYAKSLKEK